MNSSQPQIGTDAAGDLTAVWVGGSVEGEIKAAYRPAGGSWTAVAAPIATAGCKQPALAVNAAGAAVVVAVCGTGTTPMRAAFRPAGGSWGSETTVTGSGEGEKPRVGIDDAGNAIAVWSKVGATVQSSFRPTGTGSIWAAAVTVSDGGEAFEPALTVEANGIALATWTRKNSSTSYEIKTAGRTAGAFGAWNAPSPIALGGPVTLAGGSDVAASAAGQVAVWAEGSAPATVMKSKGGTNTWLPTAHEAFDPATSVEEPQVAVDGQGGAVAVWRSEEELGGPWGVQAVFQASPLTSWSSPVTLATDAVFPFSKPPQVAADQAGDAVAAWVGDNGLNGEVFTAVRPAGGGFATPVPIASHGTNSTDEGPIVAMDPPGDAFVAWVGTESGFYRVNVSMRDGSPPALSAINVPVSGETGVAATMSAQATDTWSSPVTIHWDFGDGSTATGASVSHAYATAGTKTVTVSATDAAGNTSASQTRQVVVTQKPGQGPLKGRVKLTVSIPGQSWKAIAKTKGVKLSCTLDAQGTCSAKATVGAAVAKRLGLVGGKAKKPVKVGSGSVHIGRSGQATTLLVKLSSKARTAIAGADRNVPLSFAVTGAAPGRPSASKTKSLTVKRP